jgi:hypothetical protein
MQKKTAQELKLRHKARRVVNPTGKALTMLSPAFKKVIRDMDKLDKRVRKEAEDLNFYIGMARSSIRRKDFLTAATYLSKFHEKAKLINHQLKTFDGDISKSHREYLLKNFKGKDKSKLFDYDPNKDLEKINVVDDGLISTAGTLKDWWRIPGRFTDMVSHVGDQKYKGMKALEKSFSVPFYKQLKNDTKEMLDTTNDFYKALLLNFHALGSAWGTRNVGAYIEQIKEIETAYKPYHAGFVEYYSKNIGPMKERQAQIDEEAKKDAAAQMEANKKKEEELAAAGFGQEAPSQGLSGPDMSPGSNPSLPGSSFNPAPGSDPISYGPTTGPASSGPSTGPMSAAPNTTPDSDPFTMNLQRKTPPSSGQPFDLIQKKGPSSLPTTIDEIVAPGGRSRMPSSEPFGRSPSYRAREEGPATTRSPGFMEEKTMPSMRSIIPSTNRVQSVPTVRVPPPSSRKVGPVNIMNIKDVPTQRGVGVPQTVRDPSPASSVRQFNNPNLTKNDTLFTQRFPFHEAHEKFLGRIEVLSSEEEVVREILNYSEEVEKYSEEESLKLIAVAEGILEKRGGVFDKFTSRFKDKKDPNAPKDPEAPPSTEEMVPATLPAGTSPVKTERPSEMVPVEEEDDILSGIRPPNGFVPINHGIPEGSVEKRWGEIPFLAKIRPDQIGLSTPTANGLLKKLLQYFHHNFIPVAKVVGFNEKLIAAVKKSITRGVLVSNMACGDKHNGRDCALEVFGYVRLGEIDPVFSSLVVSYTANLRLSVFTGEVVIRKLNNPKLHIDNKGQ